MKTEESNIFFRGKLQSGTISFHEGVIDRVKIRGPGKEGLPYLFPGFIDIHVHGSCGHDFLSGGKSYEAISRCLPRNGVTSFMPTFAAAPVETFHAAISAYAGSRCDGADPFAIHLEGPFINPAMSGAQNPEFMRPPDIGELMEYVTRSMGRIGLVTVAPELPGAKELIQASVRRSISCSIGHTVATYEQAAESFGWGVTIVNHSYNAMTPFHHRKPGVVGAMLLSKGVFCELIADGIHVSADAVRLLLKNVGAERIVLITDGIMAQNGPDGHYETEAFAFDVNNGIARLADGALAGSTLTMDNAMKNMVSMTSLPLEKVVPMLTSIPARAAGLTDRGELETGRRADMVMLDRNLGVTQTFVAGRSVYSR